MKYLRILSRIPAILLIIPIALSLSINLVHQGNGEVEVYFTDNPNSPSIYEANITVRNSTYEQTLPMEVEGYGKYRASKKLSLPEGYYDFKISISNSTHVVSRNYSETGGMVVNGSSFIKIVFNISVSSDPSFDTSYFNGNSEGDGTARYMYSGNQKVFALVFPLTHASLQRTPYSIMSVNSSLIYIGFGNISIYLESFSNNPGISIMPGRGKGNYRVFLARDDVYLQAEYCGKGDRKITLENKGFKNGKPWIKVDCI